MLNGSNYKKWKQDVNFALGIADLDIALREDKPVITTTSTAEEKERLAKWERADRLSLIAIKRTISEHLLGGLPDNCTAKEFLAHIKERYKVSDNAESGRLLKELMDMKYDTSKGVREFILKIVHYQTKLKTHKIDLNDKFIVGHALNCLPVDFTQIKTAYNTIGEDWSVNDLITKSVAEEEKLKNEKTAVSMLSVHSKPRVNKSNLKNKYSSASHKYQDFRKPGIGQHRSVGGPTSDNFKRTVWCFWCKEKGHKKPDCPKFKTWLDNKQKSGGTNFSFVCFESNLVDVPIDSWWLDSGSTTHIAVSLQGFRNLREPSPRESKLRVGNDLAIAVESVGDVSIVLDSGFELVLKKYLLCTFL
jgi:hypothetical protein